MRLRTPKSVILGLLSILSATIACAEEPQKSAQQLADVRDPLPTRVASDVELTIADTVVEPRLDERTSWLVKPQRIETAASPDAMWAIDRSSGKISQFGTGDGRLIRTIGRKGPGPDELQLPWSAFDTDSLLYVLDRRAQQIAAFDKDGNLDHGLRVTSNAYDFLIDGDQVVVVPGSETLLDVYTEGRKEALGPPLGDSLSCRSCELALLSDGRVVISEPSQPRLLLVDRVAGELSTVDLRNDVIDDWQSEVGQRRTTWIAQIIGTQRKDVSLLMNTPGHGPNDVEMWSVNVDNGNVTRMYSGKFVVSAVELPDGIYALLGEYRIVSPSSGETTENNSPVILRYAGN